ncbi:MAG: hypothetical protein JKY43_08645 [Phycisphaerales bacterium]|nr:hypothetical protein [Phycisphaerales bacterium]
MTWFTLKKQMVRRRWSRRATVGVVKPFRKSAKVRAVSKCYSIGWMILSWWYLLIVGYWGGLYLVLRIAVDKESDQLNKVIFDNLHGYLYGFYVIPILVPLAFLLVFFGRKKVSRAVIRTRGNLCLNCAYDLRGRALNDHVCPECGKISPRRECVRLWAKLLRSRI